MFFNLSGKIKIFPRTYNTITSSVITFYFYRPPQYSLFVARARYIILFIFRMIWFLTQLCCLAGAKTLKELQSVVFRGKLSPRNRISSSKVTNVPRRSNFCEGRDEIADSTKSTFPQKCQNYGITVLSSGLVILYTLM